MKKQINVEILKRDIHLSLLGLHFRMEKRAPQGAWWLIKKNSKVRRLPLKTWQCEIHGASSDYLLTVGVDCPYGKFTGPFRWRSPLEALYSLFGKLLFRLIVVEIWSSPAATGKDRCQCARCPIHREQSTSIHLFFLPFSAPFSPFLQPPFLFLTCGANKWMFVKRRGKFGSLNRTSVKVFQYKYVEVEDFFSVY